MSYAKFWLKYEVRNNDNDAYWSISIYIYWLYTQTSQYARQFVIIPEKAHLRNGTIDQTLGHM